MLKNNKNIIILLVTFLITSCASVPNYRPVIDTSNISDKEKYAKDLSDCEQFTNNVDYSDEEVVAGLKGAAVGATVVGAGAAVVAAAGGIVLAPVALPIAGAAALLGGGINSNKTNSKEQKLRAVVWNNCLKERGYSVLSTADGLN
ncbi:MAG: hypothetical protein P8N42_00030 [Hyphomicrobiales bacterium]|jgi:hypothetical protein|nr:hypothetical protein [Hyphomicrobiales bacterium]|tara:strand:+ start:454 stop:891 length:438 start_codon:yes stop_codon:yes gene_type:complete